MIKLIKIKNFKCYKDCNVKFDNISVVCGPNSSGKSSLLQTVLLFMQNNGSNSQNFNCNGDFVHFDRFEEIKNSDNSAGNPILISIYDDNRKVNSLCLKTSNNSNIVCEKFEQNFSLKFEENIYFLSACRIGPEDVYNKFFNNSIGQFGENAIGFLAKFKEQIIDEKYAYEKHPKKDYMFIKEINFWLKKIVGERIYVDEINQTNKSFATYAHDNDDFKVRNKNTGTGISFVITILIMVFSLSLNSNKSAFPTFIIENPEVNLHPVAQYRLMDFLIFMSKFCQIIIETHSDHIIKKCLGIKSSTIVKISEEHQPIYFNYKSKFALNTLCYGELQRVIFDLPTIDFHIALFSYLQILFNEFNINKLDDEIRNTKCFKNNSTKYDTKSPRFKDNNKSETLPVYLRNMIDHPVKSKGTSEPSRLKFRSPELFEKALADSINFMIDIIKEKTT